MMNRGSNFCLAYNISYPLCINIYKLHDNKVLMQFFFCWKLSIYTSIFYVVLICIMQVKGVYVNFAITKRKINYVNI